MSSPQVILLKTLSLGLGQPGLLGVQSIPEEGGFLFLILTKVCIFQC